MNDTDSPRLLRQMRDEWKARAEAAEATVARVEAALAVVDEVAYSQIAGEKMLTIMPTGPNRARVPVHWREETEDRARAFRQHFRTAMTEPTP